MSKMKLAVLLVLFTTAIASAQTVTIQRIDAHSWMATCSCPTGESIRMSNGPAEGTWCSQQCDYYKKHRDADADSRRRAAAAASTPPPPTPGMQMLQALIPAMNNLIASIAQQTAEREAFKQQQLEKVRQEQEAQRQLRAVLAQKAEAERRQQAAIVQKALLSEMRYLGAAGATGVGLMSLSVAKPLERQTLDGADASPAATTAPQVTAASLGRALFLLERARQAPPEERDFLLDEAVRAADGVGSVVVVDSAQTKQVSPEMVQAYQQAQAAHEDASARRSAALDRVDQAEYFNNLAQAALERADSQRAAADVITAASDAVDQSVEAYAAVIREAGNAQALVNAAANAKRGVLSGSGQSFWTATPVGAPSPASSDAGSIRAPDDRAYSNETGGVAYANGIPVPSTAPLEAAAPLSAPADPTSVAPGGNAYSSETGRVVQTEGQPLTAKAPWASPPPPPPSTDPSSIAPGGSAYSIDTGRVVQAPAAPPPPMTTQGSTAPAGQDRGSAYSTDTGRIVSVPAATQQRYPTTGAFNIPVNTRFDGRYNAVIVVTSPRDVRAVAQVQRFTFDVVNGSPQNSFVLGDIDTAGNISGGRSAIRLRIGPSSTITVPITGTFLNGGLFVLTGNVPCGSGVCTVTINTNFAGPAHRF